MVTIPTGVPLVRTILTGHGSKYPTVEGGFWLVGTKPSLGIMSALISAAVAS